MLFPYLQSYSDLVGWAHVVNMFADRQKAEEISDKERMYKRSQQKKIINLWAFFFNLSRQFLWKKKQIIMLQNVQVDDSYVPQSENVKS